MSLLRPLTEDQGVLKAGFLGFAGSGKTFTASLFAIGLHKHIGSTKPIAMFDTEGGSAYVRDLLKDGTGKAPVGIRARSLNELIATLHECEAGAADILLVDSITHPWRECCESYLAEVNERSKRAGRAPRYRLEFQDWSIIKEKWNNGWATPFLNSPIHIIICGRAGDVYEYVTNESTGKKELQVTGIKMKTEAEFGFEPSLIVEMEGEQVKEGGIRRVDHVATIIKDRFNVIQGKSTVNPGFEFFLPHVLKLIPGGRATVDAELKTAFGLDEDGNSEIQRARRNRVILLEEIQAAITEAYPGQTREEKAAKVKILKDVFQTGSWTAVEGLGEVDLAIGYDTLKSILAKETANAAS
jgi:hypothetical protein